jgi:hypothetical protein
MSVYRDAAHAISRIMCIETIDGTKKASWQSKYQSGFVDGCAPANPCPLSESERLTQDSMTRAAIHRALSPELWHALVAKYSINDVEVAESVRYLIPRVVTPAHTLFKMKCVTAWAIPKKRGVQEGVKTSRQGLPDAFYDVNSWDADGTPEGSLRRWKHITMGWLNGRVDQAFQQVTSVLEEKGLIERNAA